MSRLTQHYRHRDAMKRLVLDAKLRAWCHHCQALPAPETAHLFHWHHRDPATRRFKLSLARDYGRAAVLLELDKCDLLCADCHRQHHAQARARPAISPALPPIRWAPPLPPIRWARSEDG